ncbi:helix-turn-helix transcriptional regulator [Stutzerimonas xanthomarina]|uniref:Transcriptional regulator, AraC family n=2 Tax=Stutzerimonas xanthomarina TaxID=271420 RepID=A0A1M5K8M8_9GAMM|nr:helix-turn-helix transcriptional regulator [Stutzerimonas xanthomarina]MCP9336981.1 helix-turn-helix transcriptional regulator [Stutzerimonas xanthomarina]SEI05178.1 Helix-turn-helix domain-containing protein [Stutzerimonas xanthomarina]SHG49194.1 transcriptional regulator, AraC family [Stutzerimonas xanthomarina DSM 18231]
MPSLHEREPRISGFAARPPSPALAAYVQRFWWLDGDSAAAPDAQLLHPDGGCGLIFNFAEPLQLDGAAHSAAALIAGPQLTSSRLQLAARVKLMGVRFRPGMGSAFFGVGLDELSGVHLDDGPGLGLAGLSDALTELDRDAQQRLVERELLARLNDAQTRRSPALQLLSQIAAHQGRARLSDLMQAVPLGQRQLERLFRHQVGLTPKQFSRIQRVALVRGELRIGGSLLDTALSCGYADQAHFIHDFKSVVGMTPGQYRLRAIETTKPG